MKGMRMRGNLDSYFNFMIIHYCLLICSYLHQIVDTARNFVAWPLQCQLTLSPAGSVWVLDSICFKVRLVFGICWIDVELLLCVRILPNRHLVGEGDSLTDGA